LLLEAVMTKRGKVFALLAVLTILTAGCATKVPVNMLKPANYHEAAMAKTVAVVPFNGRGGQEFASEIEGVLGSITIDDRQYFTLIDRTSLDKVMSEMKFSQSGLVDSSKAVQLGRMLGAQGIYTGTVQQSFKSSPYRENREECARYEEYKDSKGRTQQGKCLRYRKWSVHCTKNVMNFVCNPKLVEVETGRVVYARNLAGFAEDAKCEDVGSPKGEYELLETAKSQVKQSFRQDIAPYYETRMIKLMDSTDGIANPAAAEKLKQGITWAGKKRLDKACELWGEAASMTSTSYALAYDLGVCAESRADVEAALKLYKKAEDLLGKPDDDISLAVMRTSEAVKNVKKLSQQMKSQETRVAPASSGTVEDEADQPAPPPKKKKKKSSSMNY
jgi:tetratricopeptide (TPR) repeat protein